MRKTSIQNKMYHFAWVDQREKQGYKSDVSLKAGIHLFISWEIHFDLVGGRDYIVPTFILVFWSSRGLYFNFASIQDSFSSNRGI